MKSKFNTRLFGSLSAIAIVVAAPSVYSATEAFNTAGTVNWVCPPGVTSIQVECWGGGGAGGAATKVTDTGSNTSQNGGGGGGGAYARRVAVPVTPGFSYTITIPAAAVSVAGTDTTSNTRGQTGGTVTFVGDLGVTVTAVGGQGGVSIWRNTNQTAGGGAGAGGTVAASSGDPLAVFAGGAGSAGNTGSTNVSGSGGGGAGNAGDGGAGFTSTASPYVTAGVGGTIGGGAGGVGRTGSPATSGNTNKGVGTPGATPGGGGGGAKNQAATSFLGGSGGLGQIVINYPDPPNFKANNTDALNLASSWTSFVPTGALVAKWDATVTGANTTLLGGNLTFAGIQILDPGGLVTIDPGNTLTLGGAPVDLDLSTATQDLTLKCDLALGFANVWDVANGRTLSLNGVVSGSSAITKQGGGTAILTGVNTYNGTTTVSGGSLNLNGSLVNATLGNVVVQSGGTLNASGTLTGSTTTALTYGSTAGISTVNVSSGANLTLGALTGSNNASAVSVYNQTGGTVNLTAATATTDTSYVAQIGYGYLNLTGGSLTSNSRFSVTFSGSGPSGVARIGGGAGAAALSATDLIGIGRTGGSTGEMTVLPNGTVTYLGTGANNVLLLGNATNTTGFLNIVGGTFTSPAKGISWGNGTSTNGGLGLLNLGAGTLEIGANVVLNTIVTGNNRGYVNLSGGTLKLMSSAITTGLLPAISTGFSGLANTIFGPVSNSRENLDGSGAASGISGTVGITQDFAGGVTINTNGFNSTFTSQLMAPTGNGVAQGNLSIIGGSGYVAPPSVKFSLPAAGNSTPAAGYALVSGGQVTGIVITCPGTYDTGEIPTVTLNGGGGTGASVTVTGPLAANTSGGLTKTGAGNLTLTGANTYKGTTTVNAGQFQISGSGSIADTSGITVAGGASFNYLPSTVGSILTLGAGSTLTLANASSLGLSWDATTASRIAVSGAASIGNNVLLNLSGSYASGTPYTILTAGSGLNTGSYSFLNVTDATFVVVQNPTSVVVTPTSSAQLSEAYWTGTATAGMTRVWAASNAATDSNWSATAPGSAQGLVPGSGTDVFISANTVNATPTNTVLGANMSIKSLTIADTTNGLGLNADGNALTLIPAVATTGITMAVGVPASTLGADLIVGADQTWTNNSSSTLGLSGSISGSFGLTKAGTGTISFSGGLSFTGPLAISAGNLVLSPAGALTLANSFSGAATLTANPGTNNLSLNGNLSGFIGTLNVGASVASPGKLVTGASSTLGAGAIVNIVNGATWFNNGSTQTGITVNVAGNGNGEGYGALRMDSGAFDATSSIVLQGNSSIGGLSGTGTIDSVISQNAGPFTLTKVGASTLALGGSNSYSGGTSLNAGIINVNHSAALGTGTATINGGTRYALGNGVDVNNAIVIGSNSGVAGFGLINVITGNTATVSGPITINNGASAGGHFATQGTGVLNVTGVITSSVNVSHRIGTTVFSGGGTGYSSFTIGQGTVKLGANNGLATTATMSIGNSAAGIFDLAGFNQTMVAITKASNAATIGNSSTTSNSTLTTTGTSTFAGIIQDVIGSGTMKVNLAVTSGALTLTGINTYTGDTTVNGGTFELADNAQLKFVLGAATGLNNSLTGTGTVILNGDFVIDTSAADALASGTWTLENVSTLTGAYGASFNVVGFTDAGSNKWTKANGAKTYTFDETTGILTLTQPGYASWIDGFFPGETNPLTIGVKADPDLDGIANGVEMVIGGDPKLGMDNALLPTIELVTDPVSSPAIPAGDYILFTYRRTDLSVTGGVATDCETDIDLVGTWTAATGAPGVVIQEDDNYGSFIPAATSNTDRVRVYMPRGANIKIFGRLSVVVP